MMLDYSPIVLDSINHDNFPRVELYVKHEDTYTLYKPADTKITIHNIERLRENGTEFVYINSANSEEVHSHLENGYDCIHSNRALTQFSKNLISGQLIIGCINNVFNNPQMAAAFHKCRAILKQISFEFENRDELISLLLKLEQHFDKYLVTHTAQVTILSMYLYEKLFDCAGEELIDIGVGAMLHDIGMLYISSDIVEKTDVLSEREYLRVKAHPKHGSNLLIQVGIEEQMALDIALCHHERYDGSGYSRGLRGEVIPKHAMLVSICDIFSALIMNRPYKSASKPEEALEILKSERMLFDPEIIDGVLEYMSKAPSELTTTEKKSAPVKMHKIIDSEIIQEFRRKMECSKDDRNELLKLLYLITDSIGNSHGEERGSLVALKSELKELLNSMFAADRMK